MDNPNAITDVEALQAVRDRNAAYDGRLYFAVVTTGVYCRPSCSARQANIENLRFFDTADSAVAAGFRACKRCKPENVTNAGKMIDVARFIEAHADEKLTLTTLSKQFALSATYLQKAFRSTFGLSPKVFQDGIRQQKFKSLLREGESVTDAVFAAGYGSSSRVYEKTAGQIGMTPGAYRAGAEGELIRYTCGHTQYGQLMLAATDKGVCFAMLGSVKEELLQQLHDEFPNAQTVLADDHIQIATWFIQIDQYLSAHQPMPTIPLDLRGTAFQMRVWHFLQTIASGKVLSYKDVAEGIDQPKAVRAAATACAKNRVALLVPCHRVLRGDGAMGGYRWGVETKRALLAMEGRGAAGHEVDNE